jgi:hypothetical protein
MPRLENPASIEFPLQLARRVNQPARRGASGMQRLKDALVDHSIESSHYG